MLVVSPNAMASFERQFVAAEVRRAIAGLPPVAGNMLSPEGFEAVRAAFSFDRSGELLARLWQVYAQRDPGAFDWLAAIASDAQIDPVERARRLVVLSAP